MSCCLKNYAKKTIVLTPLTPLTPLTSELAKLEYTANNDRDDVGSDEHNSKHIHPRFTGNDKGLYATMKRWCI